MFASLSRDRSCSARKRRVNVPGDQGGRALSQERRRWPRRRGRADETDAGPALRRHRRRRRRERWSASSLPTPPARM